MIHNNWRIGRRTYVVDCRETSGVTLGGSLAFPGTMSEARHPDVVVVAMSSSARHITKPVCQITYALRDAGIKVSVLVLSSGSGTPSELAPSNTLGTPIMDINPIEVARILRHKLAIIHLGNVPSHFIPKLKRILEEVEIPVIVISQAPIDFNDLEKHGIRTIRMNSEKSETRGMVVDIVCDVVRGQFCSFEKLDEIMTKIKRAMKLVSEEITSHMTP